MEMGSAILGAVNVTVTQIGMKVKIVLNALLAGSENHVQWQCQQQNHP